MMTLPCLRFQIGLLCGSMVPSVLSFQPCRFLKCVVRLWMGMSCPQWAQMTGHGCRVIFSSNIFLSYSKSISSVASNGFLSCCHHVVQCDVFPGEDKHCEQGMADPEGDDDFFHCPPGLFIPFW